MNTNSNSFDFISIYHQYFQDVCRFLNYYTHDKAAIEDIVQDVFVKLWDTQIYLDNSCVKAYLFHVARNSMLNYLRNTANRNTLLEKWNDRANMANDCFDLEEFSEVLSTIISDLPPRCRLIFEQCKFEMRSYAEVATSLGLSVKTVENQMGIALKQIKSEVRKYYESPQLHSFIAFFFIICKFRN